MRSGRGWIGAAGSALAVAVVIWQLGTGPLLAGLEAVDRPALLAAAVLLLVTNTCSAWRWTIVARGLGVRLSLPDAVAGYYAAVFLNLTLPTGVAGDVHRGIRHGRQVHDVGRAVRGVVWERAAGQVVQVILAMAVLLALPSPVQSSMPFVVGGAIAAAVGLALLSRRQRGATKARWTRVRDRIVTEIHDGAVRREAVPAVTLLSALAFTGHVATVVIAGRTVGVTAPLPRLLPVAVLALFGMMLPSVGGWGPREGITAWAFAAAGLGAGRGAAAGVTYGILVFAASLPGALVLIMWWRPVKKLSRAPSARRLVRVRVNASIVSATARTAARRQHD